MTAHIMAMKHSAETHWETGIIRRGSHIQVAWIYNDAFWMFFTNTHMFAAWVQAGFPVCCIICLLIPDKCEHVFWRGDRSKALKEARVITMDLV